MEINYKGILCRLGTYRVNGEDKPALWYISSPDDKTMYKAGFEELHYGVLGKVLTDKEYNILKNTQSMYSGANNLIIHGTTRINSRFKSLF